MNNNCAQFNNFPSVLYDLAKYRKQSVCLQQNKYIANKEWWKTMIRVLAKTVEWREN